MHRFALIIFAFAMSCAGAREIPEINSGLANLESLSMASVSTVVLSGEWIFCPDQLLTESDFKNGAPSGCSVQVVPGAWTSYKMESGPVPGLGVGTYRLNIRLPEETPQLGLFMPYQGTAFELWINGELRARNGTVSKDPDKQRGEMRPLVVSLPDSPIHLLIQISNGHDKSGGMWNAPRIGRLTAAESHLHRTFLVDSLMAGMLLLSTSFSFLLFGLNRTDRASLYFGFFALFALLRQLSTNSHPILLIFPDLPFGLYYRFEYLGVLLSPAAFLHSMNHLFPGKIHRFPLRVITAVFLFFSLAVLILPPALFSRITPTNHFFLIATLVVAGRAIFLGRKEEPVSAALIGTGFLALSIFVIHDILVELNAIQSPYLVSLGLLFFLMGHVAALAHGASRARQEQARVSASLRAAEILSNVARSLIGCDSPGTIALNLFQSLKKAFHLERLSIYIPEQRAIYSAPFTETGAEYLELNLSELHSLQRTCSPDDEDPALNTWPHPYDLPSSLCIPVREGDSLRALIFLQREAKLPFAENTRELLLSIVPYILLSLRSANMVSDLVDANQRSFRNQEFQRIVLSVLSHDLRGPLATSYTLLDHLSRSKESLQGHELDLLRGGLQDAMDLLQRLLEWARASASEKSESLESNVSNSLEQVRKDVQFRSEQKGVKLVLEPPPGDFRVAIDPHSLEVVVRNIVMNAIKYTGSGGEVRIHTLRDGSLLLIRIDDTGIGMSANRARQLLDPERRLQPLAGTEGEKGAGLGMYLSQLLLTATGGFITVDTDRPVGTRFEIHLPLSVTKDGEPLQKNKAMPGSETLRESETRAEKGSRYQPSRDPAELPDEIRVLHIEDSDLLANLVHRFLDGKRFLLDRAANPEQARKKITENRYDIILADVELEGQNGADLIASWKKELNDFHLPVIAVTAHEYESLKDSLDRGVFHSYLRKPFTRKDLREKISLALKGRRLKL